MSVVLAAVDLSVLARRVADRARLIAEGHGVSLEMLHVAEPIGDAFISTEVAKMLLEHRRHAIDNLLEWVRGRTELDVEASVIKGSAVWEIVRADRHAAITVVGSSGLDQAAVGPVAHGVATFGRTDLLVVRRQPRSDYRRIVVAVDLSPASMAAVERTAELFPDADIAVVYSLPTRFDGLMEAAGMFHEEVEGLRASRLDQARERLEKSPAAADGRKVLVMDGSPIEMISEAVRRRSADLLVVANKGAGATKMTLLGSVALGALESAPCDVLIVRVPGEFRRP